MLDNRPSGGDRMTFDGRVGGHRATVSWTPGQRTTSQTAGDDVDGPTILCIGESVVKLVMEWEEYDSDGDGWRWMEMDGELGVVVGRGCEVARLAR